MRNWKTPLKIAVTLVLVGWLVNVVDWPSVGRIIAEASAPLILAYCLIQIAGNVISAAKWRWLALLQGFRFSLSEGFFAYLSGAFINNFLPSTVGGDTYRVFWMSRTGERVRAFAVVFFDRITGLLGLFLLSGVGLLAFPWSVLSHDPVLIILGAVVLSAALMILAALLSTEKLYRSLQPMVALFPGQKLVGVFQGFESFANRKIYGYSLLWSLFFMLVGVGLSNFALFRALGAEVSPMLFLSAIFSATLVANIPISVNNIGVKEWSYVFFFGLVGVSAELAVTAALASRLLQMLISFIALPHYLKAKEREKIISSDSERLGKG